MFLLRICCKNLSITILFSQNITKAGTFSFKNSIVNTRSLSSVAVCFLIAVLLLLCIFEMNISLKEKQHIVSLHKKGYNLSQIINETGLSWKTVKRWVTRYQQEGGVKTRPRSGRPRLLNKIQQNEIFETYEEDGFIQTKNFAEKFDISMDTVRRSLRRLLSKSPAMSKSALVILAQGAEEMETVITVDMLRRGGVTVTMAGLDGSSPVLCSRQVTLVPDKSLTDALAEKPQYDAVILPGGLEGSDRLSKSSVVGTLLKEHEKSGKIIAAICAAPTAFVAHGVAKGKRVTSYPSTKEKIPADYTYVEGERVVVDGNVVTSRGPGTTYWFGLKLIELLTGKEKADQVEKGMIISGY